MTDDKGWGRGAASSYIAGTSAGLDRAAARAEERDRRARERSEALEARTTARATERAARSQDRAAAREVRRAGGEGLGRSAALMATDTGVESGRSTGAGQDLAEPVVKRRRSGAVSRTGEVRTERDTRHYQTVVDAGRMRVLAGRGASVKALAAAFGVTVEIVEAALAERDVDAGVQ